MMRAKTRHEESLGLETRVLLSSPDSDTDSEAGLDYETVLARTKYGRFHHWLMVVCGCANSGNVRQSSKSQETSSVLYGQFICKLFQYFR